MKKILRASMLYLPIDNLRQEIESLDQTDLDMFHVDIMDGSFVPNFGMSPREMELIRTITDNGGHKQIDCHMMVENPHRHIETIAEAGADIIYIHPESEKIPSSTLEMIGQTGRKAGLAINPAVSLESVKDLLPIVSEVLIMGVNPGYKGKSYMPYVRRKFIDFDAYRKEKQLDYNITLDGGATKEVITDLHHNCNIEGFVLGIQELIFQKEDYATCLRRVRAY